jgi:hypothetical protein
MRKTITLLFFLLVAAFAVAQTADSARTAPDTSLFKTAFRKKILLALAPPTAFSLQGHYPGVGSARCRTDLQWHGKRRIRFSQILEGARCVGRLRYLRGFY